MKPEELDGAVTARVPIFIGRDDRYFNDTYQMLPKDGYTTMIQKMIRHENIKLMLNTKFNEICELKDETFFLFGKKFNGKVIYTGPLDELFSYSLGELPYRSVNMHFETTDVEFYQKAATINYPNDYDYTRITEFKHIHPCNSAKTTILKEYPQAHIVGKTTPYYPIFTEENQKRYSNYRLIADKVNHLILIGRLAEYKYYDMDDIIEKALETFKKKLK